MRTTPCKGCGKPVVWIISKKTGAKIPLDMDVASAPDTNPTGALFFVSKDGTEELVINPVDAVFSMIRNGATRVEIICQGNPRSFMAGADRVGINHFRTCASAQAFSKKKSADAPEQ